MEIETGWGLLVDQFERAQEFAMTMARHASPDDPAVRRVQRGEQSGGAVFGEALFAGAASGA
jgi:hypothetical protein